MKTNNTFIAAIAAVTLVACTQQSTKTTSIQLFNGTDLTGWTSYMQDSTANSLQEFGVKDGVIALSGKYGYIRTQEEYDNYKLNVEWRWIDSATNSGIFIQVGEDGIWPNGYECQLWVGKAGDLINSGGADCAEYRADTSQMVVSKRLDSNEKPVGEWNSAEIICVDSTITVSINGALQNEITGVSNTKGSIGLQSEGGPIEFRNVELTPIE